MVGWIKEGINKGFRIRETLDPWGLWVYVGPWGLVITNSDPQRELEALLCGCLLASARAERGQPCRPSGVPANAEFHDMPLEKFSKSGERFIVCCASPYLERPVATIGLGDTFLAGTLLVLGQAEPALANVQH